MYKLITIVTMASVMFLLSNPSKAQSDPETQQQLIAIKQTLGLVLGKLQQIDDRLGSLEGRMDQAEEDITTLYAKTTEIEETKIPDLEGRAIVLETDRNRSHTTLYGDEGNSESGLEFRVDFIEGLLSGDTPGEGIITMLTDHEKRIDDLYDDSQKLFAADIEINKRVDALFVADADMIPRVSKLETKLGSLQGTVGGISGKVNSITKYIKIGNKIVTFQGANVRITNGAGGSQLNGLGNLIVGTNALDSGSHNLVVGDNNKFESYGGFVSGMANKVTEPYSSISGGVWNMVTGKYGSISGGFLNNASGEYSSVLGGSVNTASGHGSSILGGRSNHTSEDNQSIPSSD